MYNQKIEPPVKNMKFIQYEFFVENEENSEHDCVDEKEDNTTQNILMNPFAKRIEVKPTDITFDYNEKGVIGYSEPFCKHCHSRKVVKYGSNKCVLIQKDGKHQEVHVQRYKCKKMW